MKSLVVLAVTLISVNAVPDAKAHLEKFDNLLNKCTEETGASKDDVAFYWTHKIPETHVRQCLLHCIYKSYKLLNEDGTINLEGAKKLVEPFKARDPELFDKMLRIDSYCEKQTDLVVEDHCVTAANVANCYLIESKKLGLDKPVI